MHHTVRTVSVNLLRDTTLFSDDEQLKEDVVLQDERMLSGRVAGGSIVPWSSSSTSTSDSCASIGRPAKRRKLTHRPRPLQAVSHSVEEGLRDLAKNGGLKLFCEALSIMRRDEANHTNQSCGLRHITHVPPVHAAQQLPQWTEHSVQLQSDGISTSTVRGTLLPDIRNVDDENNIQIQMINHNQRIQAVSTQRPLIALNSMHSSRSPMFSLSPLISSVTPLSVHLPLSPLLNLQPVTAPFTGTTPIIPPMAVVRSWSPPKGTSG